MLALERATMSRPQFPAFDSQIQVYLLLSFRLSSFSFVSTLLCHLAAGVFPEEVSCHQCRKQTIKRKQKCH